MYLDENSLISPSVSRQLLDDPLLLGWFAQNPSMFHPKLHAVPVGMENARWDKDGTKRDAFEDALR